MPGSTTPDDRDELTVGGRIGMLMTPTWSVGALEARIGRLPLFLLAIAVGAICQVVARYLPILGTAVAAIAFLGLVGGGAALVMRLVDGRSRRSATATAVFGFGVVLGYLLGAGIIR